MKKLLISPYFGKLPNYFQIFLDSCGLNDSFVDFLIVTDDATEFVIPDNVKIINMSFTDFSELTKRKIGDAYEVSSPYKICDYRPAFGKIFEDYLAGYDFWGHVDTDMILGNLSNFLPEKAFIENDRLLERGALMFYKNKKDTNELFLQKSEYIINFNDAVKIDEPCFYDEIMFPALLKKRGYKTYSNTSYADILPQYLDFTIHEHCKIENKPGQYFVYQRGKGLFQEGDGSDVTECMYVHIQKRSMSVEVSGKPSTVYIQENRFGSILEKSKITRKVRILWRINYFKKQFKKLDLNHIKIHLKTREVRRRIQW